MSVDLFEAPEDMILLSKGQLARLLVRMDLQNTPLRALHDPEHPDHDLAGIYNHLVEVCLPYLEKDASFPKLQTASKILMLDLGNSKVSVIKAIRKYTLADLRSTKDLVEKPLPVTLVADWGGSLGDLQDFARDLTEAGATVEIR